MRDAYALDKNGAADWRLASVFRVVSSVKASDSRGMLVTKGRPACFEVSARPVGGRRSDHTHHAFADVGETSDGQTASISRAETGVLKAQSPTPPVIPDQDLQRIVARDRETVRRALRSVRGLSPALVAYVIPLLAWNEVSDDCIHALRTVAEERGRRAR